MQRSRVIEHIDAALTGRQFDPKRAAATASRWPGDGVDGSLATATNKAIQMDADMHKMQQEAEAHAGEQRVQAPAFQPGPQTPTPSR